VPCQTARVTRRKPNCVGIVQCAPGLKTWGEFLSLFFIPFFCLFEKSPRLRPFQKAFPSPPPIFTAYIRFSPGDGGFFPPHGLCSPSGNLRPPLLASGHQGFFFFCRFSLANSVPAQSFVGLFRRTWKFPFRFCLSFDSFQSPPFVSSTHF